MTIRTRFAPSPTGSLHVGGVRTALYCLLAAHREGGQYLLRIEDTDQVRSTEAAAAGLIADLHWLGLAWDEGPEVGGPYGPYFQSQRLDIYHRFVDQLLEQGHAYHAYETREELTALRAEARANKQNFRYRRIPYSDADLARFEAEGRKPVVRVAMPDTDYPMVDRVLGDVVFTADEREDIVILKADRFPTYHFAVVIDDHHMGITDVLRGAEHLKNSHAHLGLYDLLGWDPPRHGHLPTIDSPTGGKMSKREKARAARDGARAAAKAGNHQGWAWLAEAIGQDEEHVVRFMKKKHDDVDTAKAIAKALSLDLPLIDVLDYRQGGFLPEALVNYLALLGWSPGDDREVMSLDELVAAFEVERVNRSSARFDPRKLLWMNGEYMKSLPNERLMAEWAGYHALNPDSPTASLGDAQKAQLLEMFRQRARTFAELDDKAAFFFAPPTEYAPKAVKKWILKNDNLGNLPRAGAALADCDWTPEAIEAALEGLSDGNMGHIAQPLRIAISGQAATPGIGETLAFLSRDDVLARIERCHAKLSEALAG